MTSYYFSAKNITSTTILQKKNNTENNCKMHQKIVMEKKTCVRISLVYFQCRDTNCDFCRKNIKLKTKSKGSMKNTQRNFKEMYEMYNNDDFIREIFDDNFEEPYVPGWDLELIKY